MIVGVTFMSQAIIKEADTSGDGKIDKQELFKFLSG